MRILTSCPACHRQYDITASASKALLRCACGAALHAAQPREQDARLIRCANCGAARGSNLEACEFCGARFSLVDAAWGSMCPSCYVRLPEDARFCVECGVKIEPHALNATLSTHACPRCKCRLAARSVSTLPLEECPSCAGVWLSVEAFKAVCDNKETQAVASQGLAHGGRVKFELTESEKVKYVPCPVCQQLMNRHNFAEISGVIIDVCKLHGVWLDNQELPRIAKFIADGGLERARLKQQQDAAHHQKMTAPSALAHPHPQRRNVDEDLVDDLLRSRIPSPGAQLLGEIAGALIQGLFK